MARIRTHGQLNALTDPPPASTQQPCPQFCIPHLVLFLPPTTTPSSNTSQHPAAPTLSVHLCLPSSRCAPPLPPPLVAVESRPLRPRATIWTGSRKTDPAASRWRAATVGLGAFADRVHSGLAMVVVLITALVLRKIKCSGEEGTCANCISSRSVCIYVRVTA